MDDAVLATPPANALWMDDHSIEDAAAKEKEDDAETLPKDKEDPILDHAIHYAINKTDFLRRRRELFEKGLQP